MHVSNIHIGRLAFDSHSKELKYFKNNWSRSLYIIPVEFLFEPTDRLGMSFCGHEAPGWQRAEKLIFSDHGKRIVNSENYARVCHECIELHAARGRSGMGAHMGERPHVSNKYWTRDRITEAIQEWAAQHGQQPSASEWRHVSVRNKNGRYPSVRTVQREFDSWSIAIDSAGFAPLSPGPSKSHRENNS